MNKSNSEPEQVRVIDWRENQLLEAGYPPKTAHKLANNSHVDLHMALSLLREGCPLKTAEKILS